MAIDAEPYGFSDVHWEGSDHATFYNQGRLLAPTIKSVGKLIVYPSSNASFPGSYNDLVRAQLGYPGTYDNSRFPDFLEGLIDGGVDITLSDAAFHFGVQYSGDQGNWATGAAHSRALTQQVYPSMHGSIMIWPDNDERNGGGSAGYFTAPQIQYMITAALPRLTDRSSSTNTNSPPAPKSPTGTHGSTPSTTPSEPSTANPNPTPNPTNVRATVHTTRWPRRVQASRTSTIDGTTRSKMLSGRARRSARGVRRCYQIASGGCVSRCANGRALRRCAAPKRGRPR